MSELSELDQIDRMKDAGEITQKQHDILSEKVTKKYSKKDKALKIAVVALIFALLAIGISNSLSLSTNTTTGVRWVVNNTNLAPFVVGHGGIGERIGDNTTYWNNNTPIEIFLYSHANTSGFAAEIHLFINGTKVSSTSGRALGVAEQSNRSIVATIPQYSRYSVEMMNHHHYEWYEYKILTGNVTTISGSGAGSGGCTGNCGFDRLNINSLEKNNSGDSYGNYINLSWGFQRSSTVNPITTLIGLNGGEYYNLQSTNTTSSNYSNIIGTPDSLTLTVSDGISNNWGMTPAYTRYLINTREYILNQQNWN